MVLHSFAIRQPLRLDSKNFTVRMNFMKSFANKFLEKQQFPLSFLTTLHAIQIAKERFLFERCAYPHLFKKLEKEQRAEKLGSSHHSKREMESYARAISYVRKNNKKIPFSLRTVLKLHKALVFDEKIEQGVLKSRNNRIAVLSDRGNGFVRGAPARLCKKYMSELHRSFKKRWEAKTDDPLILISAYFMDFLQIHPFLDGNGRTMRLLLMLLLYKSGHEICRYVNLDRMLLKSEGGSLRSLILANIHWKRQKHPLLPLCEYLAELVLSSYRQIDRKIKKYKKFL